MQFLMIVFISSTECIQYLRLADKWGKLIPGSRSVIVFYFLVIPSNLVIGPDNSDSHLQNK